SGSPMSVPPPARPAPVPFRAVEGEGPAVRGTLHAPAGAAAAGLVLTHGAGSSSDSPLLVALADALAMRGLTVLRRDLPLRPAGPGRPGAPPGGPPRGRGRARASRRPPRRSRRSLLRRTSGEPSRRGGSDRDPGAPPARLPTSPAGATGRASSHSLPTAP